MVKKNRNISNYITTFIVVVTIKYNVLAPSVHALEQGYCGTPTEITNLYTTEGHYIVASMDANVVNVQIGIEKVLSEIITTSRDHKHWYLITSNAPIGKKPTNMCVSMAGRNLEFNDYRQKQGRTIVSHQKYSQEDARNCQMLREGFDCMNNCRIYDDLLLELENRHDERLVIQGRTLPKNSLFSLVANPAGSQSFHSFLSSKKGATFLLENGKNFSLSKKVILEFEIKKR